jgi:predicted Zn-dependent protease
VERAQGNNAAAFSYAQELYRRDPTNEEGIIAYISALITQGRRDEAARMIDSRLDGMSGGVLRSRYLYLRSRTRNTEELMLNDLRASLFENPRNLNAMIASFEIFHGRNDERRALYYLRQALALAPDNPRLRQYEAMYAGALNGAF